MPASGRVLAEFPRPASGLPANHYARLLANAKAGLSTNFGLPPTFVTDRADAADYAQRPALYQQVEAEFVRFLLLGGDDNAPVHEAGVLLKNAWIVGTLSLDECEVKRTLGLQNCVLDAGLVLTDSTSKNLAFENCAILPEPSALPEGVAPRAISGDRANVGGSIFIRQGSRVFGGIRMQGAKIGGDFDCAGSRFDASVRTLAPPAGGGDWPVATIKALAENVAIDLTAAEIAGDLDLNSFYLRRPPNADEDPFAEPTHWFVAIGRVELNAAKIGVRMRVIGAAIRFAEAPPGAMARVEAARAKATALNAIGAAVGGGFYFHHNAPGVLGVDLRGAKVGVLIDDDLSWTEGARRNRFDGFVYDRIASESTAVKRVAWLQTQALSDLGQSRGGDGGFRVGPWDQAAKALDGVGESGAAGEVRIAREAAITTAAPFPWRELREGWALVSQYGYDKRRLAFITLGVWALGFVIATFMAEYGAIFATDASVQAEVTGQPAAAKAWTLKLSSPTLGALEISAAPGGTPKASTRCFERAAGRRVIDVFGAFALGYCRDADGEKYPPFTPWLYSLEALVPIVDFNQKSKWGWDTDWLAGRWFMFESVWGYFVGTALLGWFGSFLLKKSD